MTHSSHRIEPLPMPDMNSHTRVIYYITCEGTGVVKIGTTNNIHRRFYQMARSVRGGQLQLLGWEPGDHSLEKSRLMHFGPTSKIFGDWMVLTDEVVDHIMRCRERASDYGYVLPPVEPVTA